MLFLYGIRELKNPLRGIGRPFRKISPPAVPGYIPDHIFLHRDCLVPRPIRPGSGAADRRVFLYSHGLYHHGRPSFIRLHRGQDGAERF